LPDTFIIIHYSCFFSKVISFLFFILQICFVPY